MSKENGGPGPLDLLYAQHDRPLEDSKAVLEKSVRRKKQAMSWATELAARNWARMMHEHGTQHELVCFAPNNLEAFYHASRAEALREAAEVCLKYSIGLSIASHHDWPNAGVAACDLSDELRAMADREVKQ